MSLTSTELRDTIDQLSELRDFGTVALMACSDVNDPEARNGLSRLMCLLCDQIDAIADKLKEAHQGADNDPA